MDNQPLQKQNANSVESGGMESAGPGNSMSPPSFQLTASNPNPNPSGDAPMQLTPIETDWGKFIDTDYNLVDGDKRLMADFHFEPGDKVDATKIAFSQAVKLQVDDKPTYHDPTQEEKMSDDGYRIDRLSTKNNPVYGAPSLGDGKKLEDNSGSNSKYELGHRYEKDGKTEKKNAFMHDKPGGLTENSSMEFETTALAIDGAQKNKYYGSFSWGWKKSDTGDIEKLPFKILSKGDPTSAFMDAAEKWNDGTARGTVVTAKDDTPCYKWESGSYVEKFKLPKGVKVKRKSANFSDMGPLQESEILDGDKAGEVVKIKVADLKDQGDGKDTVDLPLLEKEKAKSAGGSGSGIK